jgi:hypothetical protein
MTMQPVPTANELAGQRTDLAIRRTVMAADRSLMAIVIGTVEYWQTRKDLLHEGHFSIWRPAFVIALISAIQ